MIGVQRPRQPLELALRRGGRCGRIVGLTHRMPHRGTQILGQVLKHMAQLVHLAALDDADRPDHAADRFAERRAAGR